MQLNSVVFLGKEYTISSQLPTYIKLLDRFEKYSNSLYEIVVNQVNAGEFTGGVDEDFYKGWKVHIIDIAKQIILTASEYGVFDLTTNQLVDTNPGVIQLQNVCKQTMSKMVDNLRNKLTDIYSGMNQAQSDAASNITGLGFSIWTNSITSALIYSSMQSSEIKRQTNVANIAYQRAMDKVNNAADARYDREELRIRTEIYYPGCNEAISILISNMMETFFNRINDSSKFDYSQVKGYSMAESVQILNNLSFVNEKEKVIAGAFVKCPYNPDVYKALLDENLLDYLSFTIAKDLGQSEILLPYVQEYCRNNLNNRENIEKGVRIWSLYTDEENEINIYRDLYSYKLISFKEKFSSLLVASSGKISGATWVRINISADMRVLENLDEKVPQIIHKKVCCVLSEEDYQFLISKKLLSLSNLSIEGYEVIDYNSFLVALEDKLSVAINYVIYLLRERRQNMNKDIDNLSIKIDNLNRKYNNKKTNLDLEIAHIQKEISNLSMLAIKKRKVLESNLNSTVTKGQQELTEISSELTHAKETLKSLQFEYNTVTLG